MNVLIVIAVITITLAVIFFLVSRRCQHMWITAETYSEGDRKIYIQRCSRCGTLRKKCIKIG